MILILAECVTAFVYLYLARSLSWSDWESLAGTLRELHFILVVGAAVGVAWGVARRHRWATKAAVVLAAYAGIPTLGGIGSLLHAVEGNTEPAVALSLILVLIGTVAQLVAFVLALRQLEIGVRPLLRSEL